MAVTQRRKLLTAAVGVATVSYVVACGGLGGGETSGNLVFAGGRSGFAGAETSGNLVAAGGSAVVAGSGGNSSGGTSSGGSGGSSPGYGGGETSGNLMAPPGCCPEIPDAAAGTTDSGVPSSAVDAAAAPADPADPSDAAVD